MQIQNNPIMASNIMANSSQPNVGDVLQVTVKERVNNQDAIVSMKGTTSTVTFEGKVPEQDKVFVEISGKTLEGNYTVKVSDRRIATPSSQQTILQHTDSQVNEAVKAFTSRGMTVTKENISDVQEFLTNGKGTTEQKMDTLQIMAQKQIAISDITLTSVHEALNGKPLSQSLLSVLDELGVEYQPSHSSSTTPEKNLTTVRTEIQREPDVAKAIKIVEDFLKNTNLNETDKKTLENSVSQAKVLSQAGQTVKAKVQLVQSLVMVEKQKASSNATTNESAENSGSSKNPVEVVREVIKKVSQEPNLTKAIEQTKEAIKTPGLSPQAIGKLQQAVREATKLQEIGHVAQARIQLNGHINQLVQSLEVTEEPTVPSVNAIKVEKPTSSANLSATMNMTNDENFETSIQNLIKDVQKEPSLEKVLEKTALVLAEHRTNEHTDELKQAHDKAQQLEGQGREMAARREIAHALSKIEQNTMSQQPTTNENMLSQAEQYAINEAIQTLKMDSQNVMVTEITKKLSQMAIDFKQLKREITRNLDNMSKMLESRIPQANVKQILESTIHKLDTVILKSDILLYTDMTTEKKLLSASSQLAEAKKLLSKGEITEANKLVKEVKANIENIMFKPSDVKVKHYVSDQLGLEDFSSAKQLAKTVEQAVQPFSSSESSTRQMYETLRKLGLTHENDAGFSLISKSGAPVDQQQNENVKVTLMKMMQNDDLKPQQIQQVEQAVHNITGQQLLNKQDSSGMQNLLFQLPYLMDKQVENIKVYVNSRKDGEKVDWENCSIYFVLETEKLGDIGVHLSSSEKNVSLSFKSNKDKINEKVAGLTEITQERFKEIGYNLNTMSVQPLREQTERASTREEEKSVVELKPTFTEKGYDFSI